MNKVNKIIIPLTVPILLFIGYFSYLLKTTQTYHDTVERLENVYNLTQTLLNQQKEHALSLSILLANDAQLKQSYLNNDTNKSFSLLHQKLALQNIRYDVQIHNKNLQTYLRSWDKAKKGEKLAEFRKGLVKVKQTNQPQVSIELGKRLNIKAISPMFNNNTYIGSIEVILGFENLQKMFWAQNANLYVLLDKKYLNIALDTVQNPKIGDFVIANFTYNQKHLQKLENSNLHSLNEYGFIYKNDYAYSYFSIYDDDKRKLGYIITFIEV